ncbi:MAG: SET domain-containing protein-lysine N-methyltransferase [Proteobacteria bacterium]|nr:SET domain-containing protein-lysine N-methyltransferase [Pseudomonadota bacterium]
MTPQSTSYRHFKHIAMSASRTAATGACYIVKTSAIHGKGVFAKHDIAAGKRIAEYKGERINNDEATERHNRQEGHHTFFFSLEDGRVIDGGSGGSNARWINHGCAPNCEAREEDGRVFIHALRDIASGEELCYDYGLIIDARHTKALKRDYACRCGADDCRLTMLAPKRRAAKKK